MPKWKDFRADETSRAPPPSGSRKGQPVLRAENPADTVVRFGENASAYRSFDFARYYDGQIDAVTRACQQTIKILLIEEKLSRATVASRCHDGLKQFLPFCRAWTAAQRKLMTLDDIRRELLESFLVDLKGRKIAYRSQRTRYMATKAVLRAMSGYGWIDDDRLYPQNPFPGADRMGKGEAPLSGKEREAVVHALKRDLQPLQQGSDPLNSDELCVCMLAIGLRSGINPQPLVELTQGCLQPHPLKPERKLLVAYKRRGNKRHIRALRAHQHIERITTIMPDIAVIIETVQRRQTPLRARSEHYCDDVFIYESRGVRTRGEITRMNANSLHEAIQRWTRRHAITADDGQPLALNLMRLRKTFTNRIWMLSGQDPWVTARLAGHTVKVSETHYLEAPPEAEKGFAFLGEIRTRELLQSTGSMPAVNTPVSKCRDTLNGQRAPKRGGGHCTDFLGCVRCRSFVVTEEDLHRLYSFYWLLVRERERMGARRWSRYFGHIVRIIDSEIAPRFPPELVEQARTQAKAKPHPYWRDPEFLEDAIA